jgi:hypothetical protein
MKKITILLMLLLSINLVSAVSFGTFRQGSDVDLKIPLFDTNLTHLDSGTTTQLTILYPNQTDLIKNESMTWNENYFNYTLNNTQTIILGEYDVKLEFYNGDAYGFVSGDYLINQGGIEPSDFRTDTITRSIYFIFALGILLFIGFLFTKKKLPIKVTFLLLALLFFLIGINLVFVDLRDVVVNPDVEGFFSFFTAISFYIYWAIGMFIGIMWIITFINTFLERRTKSRMRSFGNE